MNRKGALEILGILWAVETQITVIKHAIVISYVEQLDYNGSISLSNTKRAKIWALRFWFTTSVGQS